MTRLRGEIPEPEEELLGIERLTPEQEEQAEREVAEKKEIRRHFLANLMQSDQFREFLMEWLNEWQAFGNPMAVTPVGFPDPMATQFFLGKKAAGWDLWTTFDDVAPELASLMRRGK